MNSWPGISQRIAYVPGCASNVTRWLWPQHGHRHAEGVDGERVAVQVAVVDANV